MAGLIVADASLLVAFLDQRDSHHGDAITQLAEVERFVVHPLTLSDVLVHPVRLGIEADVLARLEAIGMIVSSLPLEPSALARLRVGSGLKLPDCVVLATALAHDATVGTFDQRVRAATGRVTNQL